MYSPFFSSVMCDAFVLILSVSNLFDGKFLTCHHKISKKTRWHIFTILWMFYKSRTCAFDRLWSISKKWKCWCSSIRIINSYFYPLWPKIFYVNICDTKLWRLFVWYLGHVLSTIYNQGHITLTNYKSKHYLGVYLFHHINIRYIYVTIINLFIVSWLEMLFIFVNYFACQMKHQQKFLKHFL